MRIIKDITGQRFGRLLVLEVSGKNKWGNIRWLCKCDCGNEVKVRGGHLKACAVKSCGCLHKEIAKEVNTKHNMYGTTEHRIWGLMKDRCLNKKTPAYKNYGGRGITVCDSWSKFENFYKDMGKRPEGLTLDRIDNEKGYCKENCRWATKKEQGRNKRNNVLITYKGETKCLSEWTEKFGFHRSFLQNRLLKGWSVEKAFTK